MVQGHYRQDGACVAGFENCSVVVERLARDDAVFGLDACPFD